MSSAAQIEANQANAQLSTGPRTPEGKFASSTNATKHGFFSKHAVLLTEQEHLQFESLRNSYVYEFNPSNIVQVALLDQLVLAAWNIERTNRLEAALATSAGIDPLLSDANANTLQRIVTYRARAERTFHKCHKELRALTSPPSQSPQPKLNQSKPLAIVRNEPKFSNASPTHRHPAPKIGRNDACPCNSGRKYKQCCLQNGPNYSQAQIASR